MSAERCERCDLPRATADDWMRYVGGEGEHLCWADVASPCAGPRVDWRARALAAEARVRTLETDVRLAREFADVKDREAAWAALELAELAGERR